MPLATRPLSAVTIPVRRGARAARRRLGSEAGFAVPTVTLMIVAALGMAGVAISTSIAGQGGAVRDQGTKSALAVAESGVEQALLHFNRYGMADSANPCAPLAPVGSSGGWCGPVTGDEVNGGAVTYWAKPEGRELPTGDFAWTDVEVVSLGTLGEVTRRVHVAASSAAGQEMFSKAAVKSKDQIKLDSNAEIHAGTATNGDIVMASNSKQCGVATVGIGKELQGSGYYTDVGCSSPGGTPEEQEIVLPPVNQGDAPENNDNHRFFDLDPISGEKSKVCWSGKDGNGNTYTELPCGEREMVIGSNSAVTLGGKVYSFCKLTLRSNSSLYIAEGANVTIYFDSPENCGYSSTTTQLDLRSNSRITAAAGESVNLAMLFVGSPDIETKVLLNSNTAVDGPCEQNFVVYGPDTDIKLDSNTKFCGALAGKTVRLDSEAQVWTNSAVSGFILPNTAPHYLSGRFVECTANAVAGEPDEGC